MFYAISWFLSFMLLALWSLTCWGLHTATVWAVSSAGVLAGSPSAVNAMLVPEWLRGWIPPELAQEFGGMIAAAGSMVQAVLATIPALAGAVSVVAWVIWALGAVILAVLAIAAHVLIAAIKRRQVAPGARAVPLAR
ncbi:MULTISPECIES: hypothetical protein [unclassified Acidovorax]|uniref:hypothetical protein n=1 Tax=unclassified Acidovorax TaxID=2684926 RepID=UPI0028831CB0|nr:MULTISPECIES: hypothetical protein [unclassified Acidovorax]